ncbi:hypothetical protein OJF2_06150 [Aquisphaera giovannonii]|uniref:Putative restriction endonuclease domain-containing protein n=2 Tax=Aquisphaera giovannonii TaxID=406548 RepID=A0A5B9VUH7_9BACT|nr:hypothetical protein OJF2_06150 [Aquisphaera giovannonii]
MPDGERHEPIRGRLVEKAAGARSGWVELKLGAAPLAFCEAHDLGWVLPGTTDYRCFSHAAGRVRRPDISFVRKDRPPGGELPEGFSIVPPDLAVEVVSPRDLASELEEKLDDYRAANIPLAWVIYPDSRSAMVYRSDGSMSRVREDEDLPGEHVIPGFRLPLGAILPTASKGPGGSPPAAPGEAAREG